MKSYILAGGFGTRFAEMTDVIPKPMIPIGKWPILLHIMSHYASFGIKDFVVLAGYKAVAISDFFSRGEGLTKCLENSWKVEVVDTGLNTTTAGRLWFVRESLPETFMLTYGDGLSDIDLNKLYQAHQSSKLTATVTAVHPPARFGTIEFESGVATSFEEKNPQRTGWINGGFFCMNRDILKFIENPSFSLESLPMKSIVDARQLGVFAHEGFWHPMDTLRDQISLQEIFSNGGAKWNTEALG
jgi:glucose-1-phosphate cytidylyltransferase